MQKFVPIECYLLFNLETHILCTFLEHKNLILIIFVNKRKKNILNFNHFVVHKMRERERER